METLIEGTPEEIRLRLKKDGFTLIRCAEYDDEPDERIGWAKTYIVTTVWGNPQPVGFSDGPI
jgi:hypothetical protein